MSSKISALTGGAPLQGTDEFPVARSGVNRKITGSDVATYVETQITYVGVTLTQTVAQVALNNGSYQPGSTVQVTDLMDSHTLGVDAQGLFLVLEDGRIGCKCDVIYQNSVMSDPVFLEGVYDISTDWITYMYEPNRRNLVMSDSVININGGMSYSNPAMNENLRSVTVDEAEVKKIITNLKAV